ncbi:MAG: hypothetical protein JW757_00620, partial [Anaerolineales bacterium]|nr:hypothetical protein [Anaerolineales bacterium]
MTGSENLNFETILEFIEGGQDIEAYELLKDFLFQNPENLDAWKLLLKIGHSDKEREFAKYRIKQLSGRTPKNSIESPIKAEVIKNTSASTGPISAGREIQEALLLIRGGKTKQARKIVDEVLRKEPGFPPAVYAKGLLSESIRDYRNALAVLAELSRRYPEAKSYYQKLANWKFQEKRRKSRVPLWIIAGGAVLFLILTGFAIAAPLLDLSASSSNGNSNSQEILEELADSNDLTCEELIARAMEVSDNRCTGIGTNQVCYGNHQLISEYIGPENAFDVVGDILGIEALQTLKASPLDVLKELWGVAVFKLKANMPGTIPGQNVTFLAFGNTEIDNDSGDMTAFYFSTGFGGIECNGVDFDGIQIEMDDGAGFEFTANDVQISLQGDAIMVAQPGDEMSITIASGSAEVTSDGVTRVLVPGTSVSIPISENLSAAGPPSEVEEVTGEQASLLCQLYGVNCPEGEVSIILGGGTSTLDAPELAEATPTETLIGFVASDTPTAAITETPTITPFGFVASDTPTPTITNTPTRTSTPTKTPVGFVASNTPTPSKTPTPTKTPVPPTATNTPVPPTPTFTNTPVPPTETPVVACNQITVQPIDYARFQITNNGISPIV